MFCLESCLPGKTPQCFYLLHLFKLFQVLSHISNTGFRFLSAGKHTVYVCLFLGWRIVLCHSNVVLLLPVVETAKLSSPSNAETLHTELPFLPHLFQRWLLFFPNSLSSQSLLLSCLDILQRPQKHLAISLLVIIPAACFFFAQMLHLRCLLSL